MKCLIILSAAVALAAAHPAFLGAHPSYHWAAPTVVSSQYHAQDELGQYSYGYAGGPSAKHEVKTWDGVTRGGYSYIDANGIVQTVNYIADPIHGFRVAATNLPLGPGVAPAPVVDTPEVVAARSAHLAAHAAAKIAVPVAAPVPIAAPIAIAPQPVADTPEVAAAKAAHLAAHAAAKVGAVAPVAVAAPLAVAAAPVAYAPAFTSHQWAAPAVVSSQYHAQDELGQYSYGYAGGPSAKHETKTWDGVTRGGYSYIDANGIVQTVNYISDPIHGFRVAATNLPLGPGFAPAPVVDTPEVVAARTAHLVAHAEAKARV